MHIPIILSIIAAGWWLICYRPNNKKMKKLLSIITLAVLLSCNGTPDPIHEVRYSADGKDSVVLIRYFDGRAFNEFYMHYVVFDSIYEGEGYDKCYEYSKEHELPVYWQERYKDYRPRKD